MDLGAMLVTLLITWVVKVIVMVFGARLLFRVYGVIYKPNPKQLWRILPEENRPEIRILWWSLALFCFSEIFCGVETYLILRTTDYFRALHAITSSGGMALFALGIFMDLNKRLIRYGEPACVINRICKGCTLRAGDECKFHFTLLLIASFVVISAAPLLITPVELMTAHPSRYLLPFPYLNNWYDLVFVPWFKGIYPAYKPLSAVMFYPVSTQILEFKILPTIASILSIIGIVNLLRERHIQGMQFIAIGWGILAYSFFELLCYRVTTDLFVGALMHEMAEFWFLIILAEYLGTSLGGAKRARVYA